MNFGLITEVHQGLTRQCLINSSHPFNATTLSMGSAA
jgi:hypothetical protein